MGGSDPPLVAGQRLRTSHHPASAMLRTTLLFVITALAEIIGCYLPHLVLKAGRTPLLLIPAAL